ncbi:response regulator transcription factor [Corynebacterium striatum]
MLSIAIVDDEQLIASSLATLLELEDDLKVTETFASGEELLSRWEKAYTLNSPLPDVLVTDLQLGGMDGVELAKEISRLSPQTAIVIVTSHSRPHQLKRALASGVQGFLPKTATAEEFATAIRTVHKGRSFIDQELAATTITANSSPLTEREAEVIEAAVTRACFRDR